jgi:hypothetical protein
MDPETKAHFERINKKLNLLLETQMKETWVSVGWITDLTGWDYNRMRQARDQGIVKYKKERGRFLYLLESLPKIIIKT